MLSQQKRGLPHLRHLFYMLSITKSHRQEIPAIVPLHPQSQRAGKGLYSLYSLYILYSLYSSIAL
eukprot:362355-Chlamydomonas_euryale.AAC.3